mgnify:FL=1
MKINAIAFDADDTLWDNQSAFVAVEQRYTEILAPWGTEDEVSNALFAVETANMPNLGFGAKAFSISLVENAVRFSKGEIPAAAIGEITELGKSLLALPATPLPEVDETLAALSAAGLRLAVFTKGELLDQENKLRRSGLGHYFNHVKVVSDKTSQEVQTLCNELGIVPAELLMVGNSFKSDVIPAIHAGAWAAHIPYRHIWKLERTQEFDNPRILRLTHFGQLTEML